MSLTNEESNFLDFLLLIYFPANACSQRGLAPEFHSDIVVVAVVDSTHYHYHYQYHYLEERYNSAEDKQRIDNAGDC